MSEDFAAIRLLERIAVALERIASATEDLAVHANELADCVGPEDDWGQKPFKVQQ